jgi:predicted CoA-binding protein
MAIIRSNEDIARFLASSKSIAVLGIKTAEAKDQPAYYVPAYAKRAGYRIIPVPVYYPEATEILGEPVHRTLASIDGPIDIVDVFRRPKDLRAHEADILAKHPRLVWLQSGIRDDAFAESLSAAGIDVVQDRCLMVELQKIGR